MQIKKFKIPNSILYLLGLAVLLNILRVILFGNTSFIYILWNILLAFVPFFISSILILNTNKSNIIKPVFIIGFIFWFIFLPNAPYVITDFIHLGRIHAVPIMYDIFLLFTSASAALLMGLYSLSHMEKMLLLKFPKKVTNILIAIIILFTSFGMYLGRFLRFNSWDLFISHNSIAFGIWNALSNPNNLMNIYSYTILFFIFIYVSYISFKEGNIK
jgi:uncharacterized membrane protein